MIAALGDVHGKWRQAMSLVESACASAGVSPGDLAAVFQVGDAEAQRTQAEADLVSGSAKYRKLGDFPEVVSGGITAPAPLFFIAGNHEPFDALDSDGGLAQGAGQWGPNVTYLGRAGLVEIDGLRVGFLSGVYGGGTFRQAAEGKLQHRVGKHATHYLPSELEAVRAAMADGVDVLLTHDWPTGGADAGHFGLRGDERVRNLIEEFQPILSLHGHMHVPAAAIIGTTQVACLGIVGYHSGDPMAAVGVWDIDPIARAVKRLA
ncbi:MAG: metallophosphoesterase [Bifidobacteriaceae bacterium]|jgi:Icc-related predicted phosphoesterase|nr:metallophosphoesterase [Bifidobacteriaceae bacterium]